ncbi:chaperonin 10-like protein [Coniochaeta sp. 2T2.1]|nr:chaperonin 10-like protein [Coniochaeta sp. 2T2.1]
MALPSTMKALVCAEPGQPMELQTVPTPLPTHGSVVIKVLAASVDPALRHILSGIFFTFPKNLVPGSRAIGRIAAIGPDTTSLEEGQLVTIEPFIRARDNPDVQILWGTFDGPTAASKKFMADNWSMASYAEYCRAPLENCYALNENGLCRELGYSYEDLLSLSKQIVAYGGFRGINLQAGETVIVSPATGMFSGAAVQVAVAMGARVIAYSRNVDAIPQLPGVVTVVNTGDVEKDTAALKQFGPADAYLDISPAQAANSNHFRSAFMAVRPYGRVSLMGVVPRDIPVSYAHVAWNNLTIRGQYMYERQDMRSLIKLAETGKLQLGVDITGRFRLEEHEKAVELAASHPEVGAAVVFMF